MKIFWLRLILAWIAFLGGGSNALADTQSRSKKSTRLPASIRALMPHGAKTVRLFRLAPAPKAPQFIVHLWTTPRRSFVEHSASGYKEKYVVNTPYVLDVFTDDKTPHYLKSLIFQSDISIYNSGPQSISLRYLDAKNKWGYVFEFLSPIQSDGSHELLNRTLYVCDSDGFYDFVMQNFVNINVIEGHYAPQGVSFTVFNRDADGVQIERWSGYPPSPLKKEILTWDSTGKQFSVPTVKPRP